MAASPVVRIRRLEPERDAGLPLPRYMTAGSAGMDVVAAVEEAVALQPGERRLIPTGLAFALPEGYEMQVRPRSGLAFRHGVTVANAPGTIDADFRGEVGVLLVNLGDEAFLVERGMRVAQLVVAPVAQAQLTLQDGLDTTDRGDGGFGHTGDEG